MMKNYITLKANAKINLALNIINKREDGYHNLQTIMQTLLLHDNIFIKKIETPIIKITSNLPWLPVDERNLVYKAISVFRRNYNIKEGIYVELMKNIPVSAGLGGGSADCAATLIGMRRLFNVKLSINEMMQIGKQLGADVPYLISQGTSLAKGIGDELTALPPHPFVYVLLAKPKFSVSTSTAFKRIHNYPFVDKSVKINTITLALAKKDIHTVAKNLFNDLEVVTATRYPVVNQIKEIMLLNGSIGALMSGSGPTVFGYFLNKRQAISASKSLRSTVGIKEVILTGIFNRKKYTSKIRSKGVPHSFYH